MYISLTHIKLWSSCESHHLADRIRGCCERSQWRAGIAKARPSPAPWRVYKSHLTDHGASGCHGHVAMCRWLVVSGASDWPGSGGLSKSRGRSVITARLRRAAPMGPDGDATKRGRDEDSAPGRGAASRSSVHFGLRPPRVLAPCAFSHVHDLGGPPDDGPHGRPQGDGEVEGKEEEVHRQGKRAARGLRQPPRALHLLVYLFAQLFVRG
mmetsp:Transcript_27339/g.64002  ORF Transcript_27339/g.64002 Transcript_27339/m.64002 type:complete len:210 (+) Transcript_27339:44-673(+)